MRLLSFYRNHKLPHGGRSPPPQCILKSTHDWLSFSHSDLCPQFVSHYLSLGLTTHLPASIPIPSPLPWSLVNIQFDLANLLFIKKKQNCSVFPRGRSKALLDSETLNNLSLPHHYPLFQFYLVTLLLLIPAMLDSLSFEYALLWAASQALPSVWNAVPFIYLHSSYLVFKSQLNHNFSRKPSLILRLGT